MKLSLDNKDVEVLYTEEPEQLQECVDFLREAGEFSIDLEFDKNHYRYGFNLCLVQVYAAYKCFVIDPMTKGLDLEPLYELLRDPDIPKVSYCFGEDFRLLHLLGCRPQNMFDTSVATRLLDYELRSLSYILELLLQVSPTSSRQKSNWNLRPLTEKQIKYAAEDVIYLLALKDYLVKAATEKGILDWIEEEQRLFDTVEFPDESKKELMKNKDKRDLSQYDWHIMQPLLEFREKLAKRFDKPSYQIMNTEMLKNILKEPAILENWEKQRGVYRKIKNAHIKKQLIELVEEKTKGAKSLSLSKEKSAIPPTDRAIVQASRIRRARADKLKVSTFKPIQKCIAKEYGQTTSTFILGNRLMDALGKGDETLETILPYKKELITTYAAELGLDISDFVGNVDKQ